MLWITLTLGWAAGRALLYPITGYFLLTAPAARAASRDYLARVLRRRVGLPDVARHVFTFASAIFERVFLLTGRLGRFRIDVDGVEHLVVALGQGRGCMLLGAHFGSFEALRVVGRHAPVRVRPVMFRLNSGAATRVLEALDPGLQAAIIELGHPGAMLEIRESLARGEIVGMLADRAAGGGRMVSVPFLGAPAAFPAGPMMLAATLDVPVFLFFGIRTGARRYLVRFVPFADRIVLDPADRAASLRGWLQAYAGQLEAECRAHPFNWFNFYPFWEGAGHDAASADPSPPAGPGIALGGAVGGSRQPSADLPAG